MTENRKVLFLADSLANGGTERQLALLVKYLPPGWERRVWSLGDGPFVDEIRRSGILVHLRPRRWRWDISPALELWRLVKAWRPNVIHSYGYMSTLAAVLPCQAFRIPLIDGTIRQANIPKRRGRIWRWSLHWGDRVIANSRAGLMAFGISTQRGRVVYNGFDPERLPLCVRARQDSNGPFTVIMVGRMHPVKDYKSFLRAANLITSKQRGSWRFWAVGSGPQRMVLLEQAKNLVEREFVIFLEPRPEVLPYICQADVGVLMTTAGVHEEGCSNAIMEYMACGLPVICSDSGGNRELVIDGQTGFVIEPGDADELEKKLLWLKDHPHQAEQMGEAGRRRIQEEFTVEQLVRKTVSVYEEVL